MLYEIHMLKNYPPVNLNRDDSGAPKSCLFGGVTRGRVSSQCLKRSWRKSELLAQEIGEGWLGFRTRKMPELVAGKLEQSGVSEDYIKAVMPALAGFGKGKKDDDSQKKGNEKKHQKNITEQVIIYAPEDIDAVAGIVCDKLSGCKSLKEVKALKAKELQEAVKGADVRPITLDMALFGRMVTSNAFRDVEAAMQVAHAISTNKMSMESDFFTAMDDMLSGGSLEEMGAGMMDDVDYNSSCYYLYASLDADILRENLRYNEEADELIRRAIPALVRTMALTNPSGKQNSFAGNILPSAVMVECKEQKVPVSLVNAFVPAVRPGGENHYDLIEGSIRRLANQVDAIQEGYGLQVEKRLWFTQKPYDIRPESEAVICASFPALVAEIAETLK